MQYWHNNTNIKAIKIKINQTQDHTPSEGGNANSSVFLRSLKAEGSAEVASVPVPSLSVVVVIDIDIDIDIDYKLSISSGRFKLSTLEQDREGFDFIESESVLRRKWYDFSVDTGTGILR